MMTANFEFGHIIASQIVINLIKKLNKLQVHHYKLSLFKLKTHNILESLLCKENYNSA